MSATNHTTNYELPIFVGTDKPAWLVDWNGAMTAIDTAIHTAEGKADQAGTDIGGIESSISTINSTLTSINNAVSQLRVDTNANTGSINTITSLIGNGEPTTTDKTIIGAINEINADVEALENYSAVETIVGTWIDDKPVYRKVITGSDLTTSSAHIAEILLVSGVDTLVTAKGTVSRPGDQTNRVYVPYVRRESDGTIQFEADFVLYNNGVYVNVRVNDSMSITNGNYSFVIEYTKTVI